MPELSASTLRSLRAVAARHSRVAHEADDLVAGSDVGSSPGLSDEVESFCSVANKDDFFRSTRIDESGNVGSGSLVSVRRFLA